MQGGTMLLLTVLVGLTAAAFYEDHFREIKEKLDAEKNQNGQASWKYGLNEYFAGKSLHDIRNLMGFMMDDVPSSNSHSLPSAEELAINMIDTKLPAEFDSRKQWPSCRDIISHIKDQANCGSCWAVSAVSVMSDRTCIASKGTIALQLSDEDVLTCCHTCGFGCSGGYPPSAFRYWTIKGVPTGGPYGDETSCKPYSIPPVDDGHSYSTPKCTDHCIKHSNKTLSKDRHYGSTWFQFWLGEHSMMRDIYKYGPIVAAFTVYSDFMYYKSGIYEHKHGSLLGGHAVRVIGWGEEEGKKYWLVANSWNTTFGENGLFRIKRGTSECGFESHASAGYAKV